MPVAISLESLERLLGGVTLRRLDFSDEVRMPLEYSGFPTQVLLRISLLPYVLPLKSERALGFELGERRELQVAVGFESVKQASRATLWHFRNRNATRFLKLVRRSLAVMLIDAEQMKVSVPYETSSPLPGFNGAEDDSFTDPKTGIKVVLKYGLPVHRERRPEVTSSLFPELELVEEAVPKRLVHGELGFPIELSFDNAELPRYLVPPPWLDHPYTQRDLSDIFGRSGKAPYTACNIILLRNSPDGEEILLSKRLIGSGAGTFAVPGGKKNDCESIRACVARELKEEVGIVFRDGHPVSIRETEEPGYPQVRSIGIVATKWNGDPKPWNREHLAHSPWRWFKLAELPSPLFFPTRIALEDLQASCFSALTWGDLEEDHPPPLWRGI